MREPMKFWLENASVILVVGRSHRGDHSRINNGKGQNFGLI